VRPLAPSPAWTLVTPYCKRTRPGRGTNTKAAGFPPLSRPSPATSLPPFALGIAPTHLGWGTWRHFTRRLRDPPVSKRRQLARQVGACCVLTNSFPSSSRWAVSSNLSNPGRCSISGVLPLSPGGGGIDDVFPALWKNNLRARPALFPADGGEGGATKAKQEAAPRRLSSESIAPAPQRGAHQASTSRLRRRRAPSPRNAPIPGKRTTPVRSRKACWTSPSYLRRRCSRSQT
jgi:hypothetical protein